jgi:hypothetical protein
VPTGLPGIDRAIQVAGILEDAIPKIPGIQGSFPLGSWRLEVASGNLVAQLRTPTGNVYDPKPVLTYNSQSSTATEFGHGWTEKHRQRLNQVDMNNIDITVDGREHTSEYWASVWLRLWHHRLGRSS